MHTILASVSIVVWMLLVSTLAVKNHFALSRLNAHVGARIGALEHWLDGPAAPDTIPFNFAPEPDPRRMR